LIGKILLIGAGGIVGLAAVGDVAVRNMAEEKIAERAEATAGGQASASADIKSFPFVPRLLFGGKAGDISLHVEEVATPTVDFARVDLDLEKVKLDRAKLLSERKAEVTEIDRARITVHIDAGVLTEAFGGLQVSFRDGALHASVGGRDLSANVSVAEGQLAVRFPGGPSASIRIPRTDLIACGAETFRVEGEELVVSCQTSEIPPALLRAAQAR
jgi:hypothetical protein